MEHGQGVLLDSYEECLIHWKVFSFPFLHVVPGFLSQLLSAGLSCSAGSQDQCDGWW